MEEAIGKHNEIYGQSFLTIELCVLMRYLGSVYSNLGQKILAFEQMQHRLRGVPDAEVISLYKEMATLLTEIDRHSQSQAMEYMKKALLICHKIFGKNNLSIKVAGIYVSAGVVYEYCDLNDEALSWYERSLELSQLVLGDNPNLGEIITESF